MPTAVFRWEQNGPRSYSPIFRGKLKIIGAGIEPTDPILVKTKALNVADLADVTVRGSRNWGFFCEAAFNSDIDRLQIERCGFQPTEYGMGTGLIANAPRFQNVGAVVTATEAVFDASHVGRRFMLDGAGLSSTQRRHVYSGVIASVDGPTQITYAVAPPNNLLAAKPGSFEAVACATTAGSPVITLTRGDIPSLVGRYITIGGCGQLDTPEPEVGSITAIVVAHSGANVTLSHPVRETLALAPMIVAAGTFIGRTAENHMVRNRTDNTTFHNLRGISGTAYDQQSPLAVISYSSSVVFSGGTKFHGSAARQNNFGGNFTNTLWDYVSGIDNQGDITAHSGYDSRFGKHIVVGGWVDAGLSGDEVVFPDCTETASVYMAPFATQRMMRFFMGQSRNDGRVGNAVKARYGAHGNQTMIHDYGSVRPLKRGLPVENDTDSDTSEPLEPSATPLAIPDWPRYLHDLRVNGDAFGPGWGSTIAVAASSLPLGWSPVTGGVYNIEGRHFQTSTGATEIAALPGFLPHGHGAYTGLDSITIEARHANMTLVINSGGTVALPAAPHQGFTITLVSAHNAVALVTMTPGGADTIQRDAYLWPQEAVRLVYIGTTWWRTLSGFVGATAPNLIDLDAISTPTTLWRANNGTLNNASKPGHFANNFYALETKRRDISVITQRIWLPAAFTGCFERDYTGSAWGLWRNGGDVPPLTTTQRNNFTNRALGVQIFNTTTGLPNYWNGTGWVTAAGAAA